jgi:hypothetical protein
VSLTVKDPTLAGQLPPEVPVMVVDKEGRTVQTITLRGEAGGSGGGLEKLTGLAAAERLGDFTLQVKPGVLPVEVEGQELTVGQPQREFENVTADVASLQSLAKRTGGDVIPPYRAADVLKEMPDRSMMILQTQSEELWNKPFALVLVLAIATAEWLLRKRAGLI